MAVFDCDGDRRPDLYFAGGSGPAGLYRNESAPGGSLRFVQRESADDRSRARHGRLPPRYRRRRHDRTSRSSATARTSSFAGTGSCAFEPANEAWGFDGGEAWTAAFSASWEAGASGWPTLAIGNYLDRSSEDRERQCFDNELIRPNASTTGFGTPTALSPGWCSLSMLFSDWDRSGRRDLRVSNDRHYYTTTGDGQEQLWRIDPGEPPHLYTKSEGWQTRPDLGDGDRQLRPDR